MIERLIQVMEQLGTLTGRGLGFVLGRHLAGLHEINDMIPLFSIFDERLFREEFRKIESAFGLFLAVALDAVLFEVGLQKFVRCAGPIHAQDRDRAERRQARPWERKGQGYFVAGTHHTFANANSWTVIVN